MTIDPTIARRAAPVALAVLLAWLTAACGTSQVTVLTEEQMRMALEERGVDPDEIVVPYEITPEMASWVRQEVPQQRSDLERLSLLLKRLLSEEEMGIGYQRGYTGTAREVFESREANCLSFSNLFVGLARELGIPVYYLRVRDVEGYEKDGDLVIVSGHITAGMSAPQEWKILEFELGPEVDYRYVEPLSDLSAMALYYSNRGAELMREGKLTESLEALAVATRLDSTLPSPWVNRGVGLRRLGYLDEAEASYRRALEIDAEFVPAYHNLSSLLRRQGRLEEADQLAALAEEIGTSNPYNYLNLGDLSLAEGRVEEARRFYRKAVRNYDEHADSHAAMGLVELVAGNEDEARRWLDRARKLDPTADRVVNLRARLEAEKVAAPGEVPDPTEADPNSPSGRP